MNRIEDFERELFRVTEIVRAELSTATPSEHMEIIRKWGKVITPELRSGFYLQMFEPSSRYPNPMQAAPVQAAPVQAAPVQAAPVEQNTSIEGLSMNTVNIPAPIRRAHDSKKLVPFVGAGLSLGADVQGNSPPWKELPIRFLHACKEMSRIEDDEAVHYESLLRREQNLDVRLSELDSLKTRLDRDYPAAIAQIFRPPNARCGAVHRALARLGCPIVATTNYDQLLEDAEGPPRRNVYTWRDMDHAMGEIDSGRKVLLKLHGCAAKPDSVIMTTSEYRSVQSDASYAGIIGHLIKSSTLLFIGYGMSDPLDFDIVLRQHTQVFKASSSRHFALLRGAAQEVKDRLNRDFNIKVIDLTSYDEIPAFLDALAVT
jgi:hypothetical protein